MAFGYGVSLTPLQQLTFYNAVANDGEMVKPSFINSIGLIGEKPIYQIDREIIMPSISSRETLIVTGEIPPKSFIPEEMSFIRISLFKFGGAWILISKAAFLADLTTQIDATDATSQTPVNATLVGA